VSGAFFVTPGSSASFPRYSSYATIDGKSISQISSSVVGRHETSDYFSTAPLDDLLFIIEIGLDAGNLVGIEFVADT
jgi:hypothetical protein